MFGSRKTVKNVNSNVSKKKKQLVKSVPKQNKLAIIPDLIGKVNFLINLLLFFP
jgi:hypothetical protein